MDVLSCSELISTQLIFKLLPRGNTSFVTQKIGSGVSLAIHRTLESNRRSLVTFYHNALFLIRFCKTDAAKTSR